MPFVKGQSGNPGGRPKAGESFATALARQLEAVKNGTTTRDRVASAVIDLALKGNLDAVKWIVDRVDGKLAERVEAETTHHHDVPDATLDAVLERYARLRRAPGEPG